MGNDGFIITHYVPGQLADDLKADGTIKQDHKEKVCSTYSILHVI